ncbi:MAG: cell surface protein SprA [Cyclobacteriaceae bacterium]|nr:cell surface protein SprA [Cyclobacteriaceae bacterium]
MLVAFLWVNFVLSNRPVYASSAFFQQTADSVVLTSQDTIPIEEQKYTPSTHPSFYGQDRLGDPFSSQRSESPLLFGTPSNLDLQYELDTGLNYTIYERMGAIYYRPISSMSFTEYDKYQTEQLLKNYWKGRGAEADGETAVSGRRLIPKIYISPVFDRIFGGSYVEINPRGLVNLDFGAKFQKIHNPTLPLRQQKNGGFEFDQQISMNVVGKIGEKLKVTANFDNNNSFDYQNNLKVEFTGFDEDIVKKLEVGNVSMPISNSLISGAQNLFGVKAQLQFGKLFVTSVASTQRGKQDQVTVDAGGVQARDFDIKASDYDENRHFFLGHFFRDHYEEWLANIPRVTSNVQITRVEVYVVNINNDTENQRNVASFMDLGEGKVIYQKNQGVIGSSGKGDVPNSNSANNLFEELRGLDRNVDKIDQTLESSPFNMVQSTHYNRLQARKLDEREYYVNRELGYISLTSKLTTDQMLAVAYEYTYNNQPYKVGELTEDYAARPENEVIYLKMLKPNKVAPIDNLGKRIPTWDLMMKNIYSLGGSQVNSEGFQLRILYRDDKTGQDKPSLNEGVNTKDVPLIELLGLDRLNAANDPPKDGNFDFVDGVTINATSGQVIFPVVEPFGDYLDSRFDPTEFELKQRYVYDTLYGTTKADAQQDSDKDKFTLQGSYMAGSSSEILLDGIKISKGSVQVTAGGIPLVEGVDFTVDYNFGKVQILNESIINSGKTLQVTYEKADIFNFQSRTLLGTRMEYRLSDDINFGATVLHHFERPLRTRPSIGEEPPKNTKYGFDVNYKTESILMTKMVDAIPLIQTKERSVITANAEFAQLIPGTSNLVDGEGTSYIDDFENTATPYSLSNWLRWKHAATPKTDDNRFDPSDGNQDDITSAYKRARIAWYTIDNVFYRTGGRAKPTNITDDDLKNHFVRPIAPQEIFPQQDKQVINTNFPTFDIAYFPSEKGIYNLNPDVTNDGLLKSPESNWAGITSAITNEVDFDKQNIEYLEFWLMDPFVQSGSGLNVVEDGIFNQPNVTGGEVVFNLGNVSEDIMTDRKMAFENGLPANGDKASASVTENNWGFVTNEQYVNSAFDNEPAARLNQDVGLDGMTNDEELLKFQNEIGQLPPTISTKAIEKIKADPSDDDFDYFLSSEHDANNDQIVQRYKYFNGVDKNSPDLTSNTLPYSPSGSTIPDNEDLNNDHSISSLEEYYEYKVDLKPGQLKVGDGYVVDKVTNNENGDEVSWYLFRIPVSKPDKAVGDISGFKSIRYIRMYLTGWSQPVVLRTANFRFVGSQWRKYTGNLQSKRFDEIPESKESDLTISVVNIEENSQGEIPYVLPPGIIRDRDNTSVVERRLNEQSIQLCVENLADKNAQAAFKNVDLNLVNYGRVKMFLHAQSEQAKDDDLTGFLRLGTGFDNYYEIEVPLKMTLPGTSDPNEIWPATNEIDVPFSELYRIKSARNTNNVDIELPYSDTYNQYKITVVGNPKLSTVTTLMIGVRNPESTDQQDYSACVWANELRVTDFNRQAGWAGKANVNLKMADFATISASTKYTSFGFGGVQSKIGERTQEESFDYDVSGNMNLDKFLPSKTGIKIPVFASYESKTVTPHYDPLDSDIPLESSIQGKGTAEEQADYRNAVIDKSERRSLNFSNVRKERTNPEKKKQFYNIENFSLSLAYSDRNQSNSNIQSYEQRKYKGSVNYNFSPEPLSLEPFKNAKKLKSDWLKLIKDLNFNFAPSNLTFRAELDRSYLRTQYRNKDLTIDGVAPNYEKTFYFNRLYGLKWNFTKTLSFDYSATVHSIVDEPEGEVTESSKVVIINNLKNFGRMKDFDQKVGASLKIPLDKLPITDWTNADIRYATNYKWTSAALNQIDTLGNQIENSRSITATGKFDLVKLYNKVGYLKEINSPSRKSTRSRVQQPDTVKKSDAKFAKGFLRLLMMVRSINASYSVKEGTILSGFQKSPYLVGMDTSWAAPGWNFILGDQDPSIRFRAAENGWLVTNPALNDPFKQYQTIDLNLKTSIEPFKDFKIQVDMKKSKTAQYQEVFRIDSLGNEYVSYAPSRSGSYSITFLSIKTAFINETGDNVSPVFQQFVDNRNIIRNRLNQQRDDTLKYSVNNQDVLIPAFIAAYSGQSADKVKLTSFPQIPLPNWRIDYGGLGKIESLRKKFSSITISHAYTSSYSVASYTNSQLYNNANDLTLTNDVENQAIATLPNENGELVPVYVFNQVIISERFAPLIKVAIRTRSRLNASVEYKTERSLTLNMSNTQVIEVNGKDFVISLGFTKANVKIPFKIKGRTTTLKNDLDFRMDISLKDTKTTQRKYNNGITENDESIDTVTGGNVNFQLKPNIGYSLNNRLALHFYYDRNVTEPRTSRSNKQSNDSFGVQVSFSLAQ